MTSPRIWRPPFSRSNNAYICSTHSVLEELPSIINSSRSILILQSRRPAGPNPSGRSLSARYFPVSLGSIDALNNQIFVKAVTSNPNSNSLIVKRTHVIRRRRFFESVPMDLGVSPVHQSVFIKPNWIR